LVETDNQPYIVYRYSKSFELRNCLFIPRWGGVSLEPRDLCHMAAGGCIQGGPKK